MISTLIILYIHRYIYSKTKGDLENIIFRLYGIYSSFCDSTRMLLLHLAECPMTKQRELELKILMPYGKTDGALGLSDDCFLFVLKSAEKH